MSKKPEPKPAGLALAFDQVAVEFVDVPAGKCPAARIAGKLTCTGPAGDAASVFLAATLHWRDVPYQAVGPVTCRSLAAGSDLDLATVWPKVLRLRGAPGDYQLVLLAMPASQWDKFETARAAVQVTVPPRQKEGDA